MLFKKFAVPSALTFALLFLFTAFAGAVGSISGQVKLEHEVASLPLPGASVTAISADSHFVAMALTDSNGQYQINNLQAGNYKVVACKRDLGCLFYPGVRNPDSAETVTVKDGETTGGIDIHFYVFVPPPPNPALITGRITDSKTGEGIADAYVAARGEFLTIIFETKSGPDGRYNLPVTAGSYLVGAAARSYLPGNYPGNPVQVNAYDTASNVDIALTPFALEFGSISGLVTNAGTGLPLPHALVVARQLGGFGFGAALTDSGGRYRIAPLPAGFYKLSAVARGFFPAVYPDSVEVLAGQDTPGINLALHLVPPPDLGTISGLVTDDSTGAPIGCAVVAAVGWDSVWHHRIVRFTHTDSAGSYLLGGLPKIPYFVIAWARGYFAEIYDNVHRFADATQVTPDAAGINFALGKRDSTAHSVAGLVSSNSGLPEAGALVTASAGGSVVGAALSLPDGGFFLDGLVAGNYSVSAATNEAAVSQNVDLSAGSAAGVNLTLAEGAGLRGDVNGDGLYQASDVALLLTGVFSNPGVLPDRAAADVNCDGNLSASDVVAELQFVFTGQSTAVCGF